MPHTLSQAVANASLVLGIVTPAKPVERVPLSTPVMLYDGVEAVVCGHSTADCNRYQVTFFNRRLWRQEFRWIGRSKFEVTINKTAIAA